MNKVKGPFFQLIVGIALILTMADARCYARALSNVNEPGISKDVPGIRKAKDVMIYEDARFGLLTSVFLWVYGLLSSFAGFLADRFSRSKVII